MSVLYIEVITEREVTITEGKHAFTLSSDNLLCSFVLSILDVLLLLLRADIMALLSYECSCNTKTVSTLVFDLIRSRCAL